MYAYKIRIGDGERCRSVEVLTFLILFAFCALYTGGWQKDWKEAVLKSRFSGEKSLVRDIPWSG